jgi:hypothetical protein
MKTTAIIPCAGDSARWNRHLGVEKQLAPLNGFGETILERTVRLLRENGVSRVVIAAHSPGILDSIPDVEYIIPASSTYLTDTILSSRDVWGDRTLVLLGDVYVSDRALQDLLGDRSPVRFFGLLSESPPVRLLGGRPEIFAFAFNRPAAGSVARLLAQSSVLASFRDAGTHACLWTPRRLKYLASLDLESHGVDLGKNELLRLFLRYNCLPVPPVWLKRLGAGGHPIWRAVRLIRAKPRGYAKRFGRLWGLYALMADINPRGRNLKTRAVAAGPLFKEIDGFAQDCDEARDHDRLLQILSLFEQGAATKAPETRAVESSP